MSVDFDRIINRKNSRSIKWDRLRGAFGEDLPDDLLPLWIADMDFAVADEILEAMRERLQHGVFGYSFIDEKWNQTAVSWLERRYDWRVASSWLSYSPGIVAALSTAILCFTEEGDSILSLTPVYGPFNSVVSEHGRRFVSIPLRERGAEAAPAAYRIDFEALEAAVHERCRALLLCSPHNPSGRVWRRAELEALARFAEKHDLLILSDEIHADFCYEGYRHIPIASLSEKTARRCVSCYSPSKTFNIAGLSASVVVIADEEKKKSFDAMKRRLHLAGNIFGYTALEAAWSRGDAWLAELMTVLQRNRERLLREFARFSGDGLYAEAPEATFLLWIDCREFMLKQNLSSQAELMRFFLHEARLALSSGLDYGPEGEGFVRFNFGCPAGTLDEALRRLSDALAKRRV